VKIQYAGGVVEINISVKEYDREFLSLSYQKVMDGVMELLDVTMCSVTVDENNDDIKAEITKIVWDEVEVKNPETVMDAIRLAETLNKTDDEMTPFEKGLALLAGVYVMKK